MAPSKTPSLLFGVAAGIAIGAAVIGLVLIGVATFIDLQGDASSVLTQHPLFVSGSKLIVSSLVTSLPLLVMWRFWQRQ